MDRFYTKVFEEHFRQHRQMLFVMGPRQVGKTTSALALKEAWDRGYYFNWDQLADRQLIVEGNQAIAAQIELQRLSNTPPLVIFDEIHKFPDWKNFLKGFYDSYPNQIKTLVTGSARLNVYKRGGDSLMGRYFYYHFHPLSLAEILKPDIIPESEIRLPQQIDPEQWESLITNGGFPDPFLKNNQRFSNRWKTIRMEQLFEDEIRNLSNIQMIGQMELLAELLRSQVGQLVSYESLAKKIRVTGPTIRHWLEILKSFYYCFDIHPYTTNIARSLLKEPKYYLWDWSLCQNIGARAENLVASHLLKAVHFWTDHGFGNYQLFFLRDKDKREVDFVITKNEKPWILVEVKNGNDHSIHPALYHFQSITQAPHVFQVVLEHPYIEADCFERIGIPTIVPAKTLLSQLI